MKNKTSLEPSSRNNKHHVKTHSSPMSIPNKPHLKQGCSQLMFLPFLESIHVLHMTDVDKHFHEPLLDNKENILCFDHLIQDYLSQLSQKLHGEIHRFTVRRFVFKWLAQFNSAFPKFGILWRFTIPRHPVSSSHISWGERCLIGRLFWGSTWHLLRIKMFGCL